MHAMSQVEARNAYSVSDNLKFFLFTLLVFKISRKNIVWKYHKSFIFMLFFTEFIYIYVYKFYYIIYVYIYNKNN